MLKKISVKNFKAIGDPGIDVELKPITLLFGPNSSGKSSIFQSLIYAYEIFINNNLNPVHTELGGSTIDFGGFNNIINNHDLNKKIEFVFHFEMNIEDIPDFEEIDDGSEESEIFLNLNNFKSSVRISIVYDNYSNKPIITEYELVINDIQLILISFDPHQSRQSYQYSKINMFHALWEYNIDRRSQGLFYDPRLNNNDLYVSYYSPTTLSRNIYDYLPDNIKTEMINKKDDEYNYINENTFVFNFLSRMISNHNDLIHSFLKSIIYVGPFREVPERNFQPEFFPLPSRWSAGLAAWDELYKSEEFVKATNIWLKKLKIPYQLVINKILELDPAALKIIQSSEDNLNTTFEKLNELIELYGDGTDESRFILVKKISELLFQNKGLLLKDLLEKTNLKLQLQPENSNINLMLPDLGIGVSQIIPIIVSSLLGTIFKPKTIIIEQPELHIHPAVQVELADLFIANSKIYAKSDMIIPGIKNYFLIETHSEHIMLRFLKRIRETSKISDTEYPIKNDDISIYFLEQQDGFLNFSKINIDERGRFLDPWPNGFFEERINEVR